MLAGFKTNSEAANVSANHIPDHKMQKFRTMQVQKSTPLKQVCSMNKPVLAIKSLDQTQEQVQLQHPFTLLLDHPIENYLLCKERKHAMSHSINFSRQLFIRHIWSMKNLFLASKPLDQT